MASRDFDFRITGDASGGIAAAESFGSTLKRVFDNGKTGASTFFGSFGGSMLGTVLGGVTNQASAAIGSFFEGSIGQASDLNETVSKSRTIFGDYFSNIDSWTDRSAQTLGLSKAAALDAASGFGNMFTQLGFAGDQAAEMSKAVVQTSADLGSFNNLETGDVADRMAAAFRGEYDSLQALIPNINAARVEAEAMAASGKTNADQLTAQEKAAAVLAIVQKDGAAAMGDFAKTADGAANQGKTATAMLEEQQAVLGQKLLPIYTQFQSFLITNLVPAISTVIGWLSENQWVFGVVGGVILAVLVPAMIAWVAAIWATTAALLANPITWIILAIVALIAAIVLLVMNWDAVVAWITQIWSGFISWITGVIDGFVGWWNGIWSAVGQWISDVWSGIVTGVTNYFGLLWLGIQIVGNGIAKWWNGLWTGIGNFIGGIWNGIVSGVQGAINWVANIISTVLGTINTVWSNMWNGMVSFFGTVFGGIIAIAKTPINGVIDLINGAIGALNGFKVTIPDWVPLIGGQTWGLSIPKIPRLATGTITSGPMLALVGDNPGGREVIAPYDSYVAELQRAAAAGARTATAAAPAASRMHPDDIKALGRELAAAIYPAIVTGSKSQIQALLGG